MKTIAIILGPGTAATLAALAQPALTIYNQSFAVVRELISLDLKTGINEVHWSGATAHVSRTR